jgi:hypothetical protein
VTNDGYLDAVLSAFIPQKPLNPMPLDPLSNQEITALRAAIVRTIDNAYPALFEHQPPTHLKGPDTAPALVFEFRRDMMLLIMSKAKLGNFQFPACAVRMENSTFIVATLQCRQHVT